MKKNLLFCSLSLYWIFPKLRVRKRLQASRHKSPHRNKIIIHKQNCNLPAFQYDSSCLHNILVQIILPEVSCWRDDCSTNKLGSLECPDVHWWAPTQSDSGACCAFMELVPTAAQNRCVSIMLPCLCVRLLAGLRYRLEFWLQWRISHQMRQACLRGSAQWIALQLRSRSMTYHKFQISALNLCSIPNKDNFYVVQS